VVDDEGVHTAGEVLEHARAVAGAVPATGKVARGRAAEIACERVGPIRSTTNTGD
jgi:hypothetical protein